MAACRRQPVTFDLRSFRSKYRKLGEPVSYSVLIYRDDKKVGIAQYDVDANTIHYRWGMGISDKLVQMADLADPNPEAIATGAAFQAYAAEHHHSGDAWVRAFAYRHVAEVLLTDAMRTQVVYCVDGALKTERLNGRSYVAISIETQTKNPGSVVFNPDEVKVAVDHVLSNGIEFLPLGEPRQRLEAAG